jgi:hypothetical protein
VEKERESQEKEGEWEKKANGTRWRMGKMGKGGK